MSTSPYSFTILDNKRGYMTSKHGKQGGNKTGGRRPKPPQDPSKPLRNVNHEKFAKALIVNKGYPAEAYQKVYPVKDKNSASACAHRLVKDQDLQNRVEYLLTGGDKVDKYVERLDRQTQSKKVVYSPSGEREEVDDNASINQALNTVFKILGCFDKNVTNYKNVGDKHVHIHFGQVMLKTIQTFLINLV